MRGRLNFGVWKTVWLLRGMRQHFLQFEMENDEKNVPKSPRFALSVRTWVRAQISFSKGLGCSFMNEPNQFKNLIAAMRTLLRMWSHSYTTVGADTFRIRLRANTYTAYRAMNAGNFPISGWSVKYVSQRALGNDFRSWSSPMRGQSSRHCLTIIWVRAHPEMSSAIPNFEKKRSRMKNFMKNGNLCCMHWGTKWIVENDYWSKVWIQK